MVKKKSVLALVMTCVFAIAMLIPTVAAEVVNNETVPSVLIETSFEAGLDGFVGRGDATLTRKTEKSFDGQYSVLVSNRVQHWNGASLPLTDIVKPGNTYRFTAYMAAVADVDQNYIMSGEYDDGFPNDERWPWLAHRTLTVEDGFVKFEAELTMPNDMKSFNLNFEHQSANVEFYLDSVTVTLVAVAETVPAVLIETSFEEGLDSFVGRGDATLTRKTEKSFDGQYSVLVSNRVQHWNGASLPLTDIVKPGNTYRFTAYMAAVADVDQNYIMSGEYDDGFPNDERWPWLSHRTLTVEDGFVKFEAELTMPNNMKSFNLNFEHQSANVEFYLDSVTVTLIAVAETVPPVDPPADQPVEPQELVYSLATDLDLQGLTVGQSGIGSAFDGVSPAVMISGTPLVTIVEHPSAADQIAFELSNRSQNWHALDIMFPEVGVQRGGSYRFVASGRISGTGNRQVQWNQTDSPWNLIQGSRVTVPDGVNEWTIDVTLTRQQINTALIGGQRGLRIQTGNAETVDLTIDDVFVYQIGDINTDGLPKPPEWNFEEPSLAKLFEPYFGLGNIYSTETMMDANNTRSAFLHHFNVVTAENGHKPDSFAGPASRFDVPTPDQFNFANADLIVDWAVENDVQLVGHALVWHSQSPNWLTRKDADTSLTREEAKERMEYYMRTLSEHFAAQGTLGAFYGWDVVNEAIASGGGTWNDVQGNWRTQMRESSPWFQAFGNGAKVEEGEHASDFIFYAFYYARKYFPTSLLYYNDYNDEIPAKRDNIAQMVEEINEIWKNHPEYDGRLLIESIGMQSHYHMEGWTTNIDNVAAALDRYIATGARVSVTELDLTYGGYGSDAYPSLTAEQLEKQAETYANLFKLYLERAKSLNRVSIWGMSDSQSWRSTGFPVLFDGSFTAKPAFEAIVDLVENWETPEVAAPVINTKALEKLEIGESLFTKLDVTTECNSPVWYSIVDGELPAGVTLHSRTGVLEGTPVEEGRYTFTVEARNYGGPTTQILTLGVGVEVDAEDPTPGDGEDPTSGDDEDPTSGDDEDPTSGDDGKTTPQDPELPKTGAVIDFTMLFIIGFIVSLSGVVLFFRKKNPKVER